MAGLRRLKGKFYARIRWSEDGKAQEKIIPLKTDCREKAESLLPRINQQEQLLRQGCLNKIQIRQLSKIDNLIYEYYQHLRAKGDSEKTVELYKLSLAYFSEIFKGRKIDSLKKSDYLPFLESMRKRYSNVQTLNIRLRCVRAFLNWCIEFDKIDSLPFKIKVIKTDQRKPKYFSNPEMEKILDKISDNKELFARVKLHLNTGLRLREFETSYLENGFIHVYKSKGKNEREIPVSNETGYYYQWLKENSQLTPVSISRAFTNVLRSLDLYYTRDKAKRSFHSLRHTFAVKTYFNTRDIYRVKNLLGHYSVIITEIYATFNIEQLNIDFGSGEIETLIQSNKQPVNYSDFNFAFNN